MAEDTTASFNESGVLIWQINLACISWIPLLRVISHCFPSESYQYELGFVFPLAVFFSSVLRIDQKAGLACLNIFLFYFELKAKNAVVRILWGESGCSY